MSEKEKFLIIKRFIDQMDYYSLLAGGAPSDEFDTESKKICRRIQPDNSAQEIADVIASVFNDTFDEHDASTVFLTIAECIKNELMI